MCHADDAVLQRCDADRNLGDAFFVGANIVLILFCTVYLVRHFAAAGLGWAAILATALAGYFLAALLCGERMGELCVR